MKTNPARTPNLRPAPKADEFEITVFGPGIGESILAHIGDNRWICVDSARFEKRPWPLHYLEHTGVPAAAIELIVATHWHSDHVDGISEIARAAPKARFICSSALSVGEFKNILGRHRDLEEDVIRGSLVEIRTIFDDHYARRKLDVAAPAPVLTQSNHRLLLDQTVSGAPVEIWALSPSSEDYLLAQREFRNLFVRPTERADPIPPAKANAASVVLLIQLAKEIVLLGSDLENTSPPQTGWNAIVSDMQQNARPPANLFKIPHHGSAGAHSPPLWQTHIDQNAIAVVTPFTSSGLPRDSEIARLRESGRPAYATALPKQIKIARSMSVERMISGRTKDIQAFDFGKFGVVRLRKTAASPHPWTVELFGTAEKL